MKTCEQTAEQLSGYLDGELNQQQNQQIALHLSQCQACMTNYQALQAMQQVVRRASYPELEPQKLNAVLQDVTSRRLQFAGFFAIVAGISVFASLAIYGFVIDNSMPWYIKLASSLVWGGGIGLFLSVLRQRLIISKNDKYNKVEL